MGTARSANVQTQNATLNYGISAVSDMKPRATPQRTAPDGHLQSMTIPDGVYYNFDLLMMRTTFLETCRGI